MENIFIFIIVGIKYLFSLTFIFKGFKDAKYLLQIPICLCLFLLLYRQSLNIYFALCFVETEFLLSNVFILLNVICIKKIAFKILISVTHNGIIARILCKIFNKKKLCQELKKIQDIDYGPRLKQGIPAQAGKIHKKAKIKFDMNGFPKFKSYYTLYLKVTDYKKSREFHFYYANRKLYKKALKNKKIRKLFTKSELDELKRGNTPHKYTWHHHQNRGKMQLVSRKIHSEVNHIGGYSIWGGISS